MGIYGDTAVEVVKHYIRGQDLEESWLRQITFLRQVKLAVQKDALDLHFSAYAKMVGLKGYHQPVSGLAAIG